MIVIQPAGAPASCRSEQEFLRAVSGEPGVFLANLHLPQSINPGAFTREVDGVWLTPDGVLTVEVKGIRATGELHTPRMDSWAIVDGEQRTALHGRPHGQALAHSKFLASFLKEADVPVGWICAALAIVSDGLTLPGGGELVVVDNVHVARVSDHVGAVLRERLNQHPNHREVSVETVLGVLAALECVESAPSVAELEAEGFRTQATIVADMETKRAEARALFLASQSSNDAAREDLDCPGTAPAPAATNATDIADAPSTTEWRIDADRLAGSLGLDPELTEAGAVVDGVAMHRRLVSYAARKDVPLDAVASVVNNPVEILGDDSDQLLAYCGTTHAVLVRALDGLALYYKPVDVARAERQGTTVDGIEITARAARQAVSQCALSLEAVARIVAHSQERWWIPGTTDVAHARGDFVAVTTGTFGPVLYVQPRSVAVAKAVKTTASDLTGAVASDAKPGARPVEATVDGVTVKVSAIGWANRRGISVETLAQTALSPAQSWPGHSTGVEVRAGEACAVVFDTNTSEVLSAMSVAEAVEYRDGVTKDGVHMTGRCVLLLRRRRVSADDAINAVCDPLIIARAEGAHTSIHIGERLAVTVEDETGSVLDFTFTEHARTMLRRKELTRVGGRETLTTTGSPSTIDGAGVKTRRPDPAMLARMAGRVVTGPAASPSLRGVM